MFVNSGVRENEGVCPNSLHLNGISVMGSSSQVMPSFSAAFHHEGGSLFRESGHKKPWQNFHRITVCKSGHLF